MNRNDILSYISLLIILVSITLTTAKFDNSKLIPIERKIVGSEKIESREEIIHQLLTDSITLEKIFDGIDDEPDNPDTWSLLSGGDVMIGRVVNINALKYKDYDWPYKNISSLLSSADFTFVNLESPVIINCPMKNTGMIFCGNLDHIPAIQRSGIDAVSISNNHMFNQGKSGLETTLATLQNNKLMAVGAPNPSYVRIKNTNVAFLAYTDVECYTGIPCVNEEQIKSDIAVAKNNSDLIVIMYHWGVEYHDYPSQRQIEIAHMSIDAGADLILGNHPHWIQPFEVYKDKLIVYSHGNLVFDQMWSEKTREGIMVEYIFNKNNLVDVKLHPVKIEDYGQPRLMEGQEKDAKVDFIKTISENLASGNY
jgi:poly-gamma-glutamate synthesis protein (capsule biosynthesis protein)